MMFMRVVTTKTSIVMSISHRHHVIIFQQSWLRKKIPSRQGTTKTEAIRNSNNARPTNTLQSLSSPQFRCSPNLTATMEARGSLLALASAFTRTLPASTHLLPGLCLYLFDIRDFRARWLKAVCVFCSTSACLFDGLHEYIDSLG